MVCQSFNLKTCNGKVIEIYVVLSLLCCGFVKAQVAIQDGRPDVLFKYQYFE